MSSEEGPRSGWGFHQQGARAALLGSWPELLGISPAILPRWNAARPATDIPQHRLLLLGGPWVQEAVPTALVQAEAEVLLRSRGQRQWGPPFEREHRLLLLLLLHSLLERLQQDLLLQWQPRRCHCLLQANAPYKFEFVGRVEVGACRRQAEGQLALEARCPQHVKLACRDTGVHGAPHRRVAAGSGGWGGDQAASSGAVGCGGRRCVAGPHCKRQGWLGHEGW